MIISVASGKGGTGKTTVATNLVLSIEHAQFIDCDVEEPNANIFLNAKISKIEDIVLNIPEIDKAKCDFCGKCAEFCAFHALAVVPTDVLVFPELCHSCGGCEMVCPIDAVHWYERVIGKVQHGCADEIDFYDGFLNVGEIQAIPIIKTLKKKIRKSRNVIIDAPPGTSCPVIESITGSDYCILVTEPTPFGLHDLKLAVEVVRHLNIPFGVVINRDGIGNDHLEFYCKKASIPILLKIPEKRKIAHLYSQGIPMVSKSSQWREMFGMLFDQIRDEVNK